MTVMRISSWHRAVSTLMVEGALVQVLHCEPGVLDDLGAKRRFWASGADAGSGVGDAQGVLHAGVEVERRSETNAFERSLFPRL
jgi:hypothetical protein